MAIETEERSLERGRRRWWYKPYDWPAGGWGSARSLAKSLTRERVIASAPPTLMRQNPGPAACCC